MRVILELDEAGCVRALSASGHAGDEPPGANVACAAVTTLVRTVARLLSLEGLAFGGASTVPGAMDFGVNPPDEARRQWLRGVTDVLVQGLRDLAAEYPGEVAVDLASRGGAAARPRER